MLASIAIRVSEFHRNPRKTAVFQGIQLAVASARLDSAGGRRLLSQGRMPMVRMLARVAAALLFFTCATATAQPLPRKADVLARIERMADWQLAHLEDLSYIPALRPDTANPRDWQQATFWVALTHVADRSASPRFRDALLAKGRSLGWRLGDR